MNLSKCELFWFSVDSFPNFPPDIRRVTGLQLLGSPLRGDNDFFKDFISSRIDKVVSIQAKLSLLHDPQVELLLLRSCLSSCKIIHLLCTVPSSVLKPFLLTFDHHLRSCLSRIAQCSHSDISWCQASLPFRFGGLGLRESIVCASAAFLGSCNNVRVLVSTLVLIKVDQLRFPNEQDAVTFFQILTVIFHSSWPLSRIPKPP